MPRKWPSHWGKLNLGVSDRLNSVDFIKGIGIISFILWHCYDYFYITSSLRPPLGRFILYTTGIFIFMSGFIVGYHYYQKYIKASESDRHFINNRLYIRAMKLVCYVFIANLASNIIINKNIGVNIIKQTVYLLISLLYTDRWDISFQVLVVIAFGLMLSPLILRLEAHDKVFTTEILIVIISACCFYDVFNMSRIPYLWRYLPLSLTGMILGIYFKNIKFQGWNENNRYIYLTCFLGLCLAAAIFPRWYKYILMETGPYLILIISVFLSLNRIASKFIEQHFMLPHIISRGLVFIGQYSLFIYFTQIIIILFISELNRGRRFETSTNIIILSVLVLIISIILTYVTSFIRKYYYVEKVYKFLFL